MAPDGRQHPPRPRRGWDGALPAAASARSETGAGWEAETAKVWRHAGCAGPCGAGGDTPAERPRDGDSPGQVQGRGLQRPPPRGPTEDEVVGAEEVAEGARAHTVHRPRLQVHQNGARHILVSCERSRAGRGPAASPPPTPNRGCPTPPCRVPQGWAHVLCCRCVPPRAQGRCGAGGTFLPPHTVGVPRGWVHICTTPTPPPPTNHRVPQGWVHELCVCRVCVSPAPQGPMELGAHVMSVPPQSTRSPRGGCTCHVVPSRAQGPHGVGAHVFPPHPGTCGVGTRICLPRPSRCRTCLQLGRGVEKGQGGVPPLLRVGVLGGGRGGGARLQEASL